MLFHLLSKISFPCKSKKKELKPKKEKKSYSLINPISKKEELKLLIR